MIILETMKERAMEKMFIELVKLGIIEINKNGEINSLFDRVRKIPKRKSITIKNPKGYMNAHISYKNVIYIARVQRIVWEYFEGEIPKGFSINHIDGNRENNNITNLELATAVDQYEHAVEILKTRNRSLGEDNLNAKITGKNVFGIRKMKTNYPYMTCGQIKKRLNLDITPSMIARIIQRKSWKHIK